MSIWDMRADPNAVLFPLAIKPFAELSPEARAAIARLGEEAREREAAENAPRGNLSPFWHFGPLVLQPRQAMNPSPAPGASLHPLLGRRGRWGPRRGPPLGRPKLVL